MTRVIQVCDNLHQTRVFIINTRPDVISQVGQALPDHTVEYDPFM